MQFLYCQAAAEAFCDHPNFTLTLLCSTTSADPSLWQLHCFMLTEQRLSTQRRRESREALEPTRHAKQQI
jgi:hypothetical protein